MRANKAIASVYAVWRAWLRTKGGRVIRARRRAVSVGGVVDRRTSDPAQISTRAKLRARVLVASMVLTLSLVLIAGIGTGAAIASSLGLPRALQSSVFASSASHAASPRGCTLSSLPSLE